MSGGAAVATIATLTAPIHVLVRDVPRLVRDMLEHAIVSQPDMVLVDEPASAGAVREARPPDVVIVADHPADESRSVSAALAHWPHVPVLLVRIEGREAVFYELEMRSNALGERSPDELIEAIRRVVRRRVRTNT